MKKSDPRSPENGAKMAMIEAGTRRESHNLGRAMADYHKRVLKIAGSPEVALAVTLSHIHGCQYDLADILMPDEMKLQWLSDMHTFAGVFKDVVSKHPSMPLGCLLYTSPSPRD